MNINDLVKFYRDQCKALFLKEDSNGVISYSELSINEDGTEAEVNATVDGKKCQFVIPTKERLRNMEDGYLAFDPLSENTLRKISPLQKRLMTVFQLSAEMTIIHLVQAFLELSVDPDRQKSLTPAQSKRLDQGESLIPTATTIKAWDKISEKIAESGDREHRLLISALQKNVEIGGRKYARGCKLRFPLYEELCASKGEVFGVKVSAKNVAIIKNTLEFLLPQLKDVESHPYSKGSDNENAPYYCAFTLATYAIFDELHRKAKSVGLGSLCNHLTDYVSIDFINNDNLEEEKEFNSIMTKFSRLIPPQMGSSGDHYTDDEEKPKTSPANKRLSKDITTSEPVAPAAPTKASVTFNRSDYLPEVSRRETPPWDDKPEPVSRLASRGRVTQSARATFTGYYGSPAPSRTVVGRGGVSRTSGRMRF